MTPNQTRPPSTEIKRGYRGPVSATARLVPPYLYEVVWRIALGGPLTAQEIAGDHNRPVAVKSWAQWTAQSAANRMRSLVKLGLIERDQDGFYVLTEFGRRWITTREA